ncbi:MAG: PTS system mannose/fructose/sorbose family transporter subunit IID [Smithellaceae bacterium]
MKKNTLIKIFLRSFFIHATLNFRRMQNLGFAYAILPLIREQQIKGQDARDSLTRHLQMFNTHPYLSTPVIGSIVRMEEEATSPMDVAAASTVKQSLMGPYAAIGDTFFWGALRPCAAIIAIVLAFEGLKVAPLLFLLLYTPVHAWVRIAGFVAGYKKGKQGIEFIRGLNLPRLAVRVRWLSLAVLAACVFWLLQGGYSEFSALSCIVVESVALALILLCLLLIKKGISQVYILYGAVLIFLVYSLSEIAIWSS